ncbi:MAG: hypothetical protein MI810_19980 [Flavobacteriales bacterium]|jgi:hypothetical protein|nr:hypothetical protein [Flavobacteriales bacterium]
MNIRPIRQEERKIALRFYWLIIPVGLIATLIIYVLIHANNLPIAARIAAFLIIGGVIVIFTLKWYLLYKDLKNGEVSEIRGKLERKIKLGRSKISHVGDAGVLSKKKSLSTVTYILRINQESYEVKAKHFAKVEEGRFVQLNLLAKSLFVLDVFDIDKSTKSNNQ